MKTFINDRFLVGASCALILLGTNGISVDANGSGVAQRSNLRRSLATPLADTANGRSLDEAPAQSEEVESTEKQFNGQKTEEDVTEELEKIEEEFDGGNNDAEDVSESAESTEEAEEATETAATDAPTETPPTMKPTTKPYAKNDDGFDPIRAEDEKLKEEEEVQELQTELKKEEKVAQTAGGLGIFFMIIAMIFTAHQMSENPDGIYASVCRLAITISSVVIKIICMPCRKVLGIGNGNPYSGHMPISTSDYSYRNDPYRSNANAGFEMS